MHGGRPSPLTFRKGVLQVKTIKVKTSSKPGGACLTTLPVAAPMLKPGGENKILASLREERLRKAAAPTILSQRSRK